MHLHRSLLVPSSLLMNGCPSPGGSCAQAVELVFPTNLCHLEPPGAALIGGRASPLCILQGD